MPSQPDRCQTPTSPDDVNPPPQPIGQTQLDEQSDCCFFDGSMLTMSGSLMGNLDFFESQAAFLLTQAPLDTAQLESVSKSEPQTEVKSVDNEQLDLFADIIPSDDLKVTREEAATESSDQALTTAWQQDAPPASSGPSQSAEPPRHHAISDTQSQGRLEPTRPKRTRKSRMVIENVENAVRSDCGEENRATKMPKRRVQSMSSKQLPLEEPKAVKRKCSAPLSDITNAKAARLQNENDSTTKPVEQEEIETCRKETDKGLDELLHFLSSPHPLPSPILALKAYNQSQVTNHRFQDDAKANRSTLVPPADVWSAAEALVELSTPVKSPIRSTPRRTTIVYANSDSELRAHGVTLEMHCYEDWAQDFGSPLSILSQSRELQSFSTVTHSINNRTPIFTGFSSNGHLISPTVPSPSRLDTSFCKFSTLYRPISTQERDEDDLGLNIVREAPKVQTPPRRPSQLTTQDSSNSAEQSEGELEESSIHVSDWEDEQIESAITSAEIEKDLKRVPEASKKTSDLLAKKQAEMSNVDENNKFLYTLAKLHELFTPEELKNGILPFGKGKCRSKTRTPLDPVRVEQVKEALAEKFKLDDFYIDILWNNMRPELNRKLAKPPSTKPQRAKAALKVKLFKKT